MMHRGGRWFELVPVNQPADAFFAKLVIEDEGRTREWVQRFPLPFKSGALAVDKEGYLSTNNKQPSH
jgi:hypothetical protein